MVRIFKTKWFVRYARRERIADDALRDAITRAEQGLVDANLGGNVIKQRVARPGEGKSGGYRTLVAFRVKDRAVFLYGFAKSERDNVEPDDLATLKKIAADFLKADAAALEREIDQRNLVEITDES